MKIQGISRWQNVLATLLVLAGPLALGVPAASQERAARSPEHTAELIERLQIGMSALEELGRGDAHELLQRIADELREERRRGAARGANRELETVRRRLQVMRLAVEAFVEVGRHDAAELVERAMHARELSLEGRRDPEAKRIRAAAPDRAQLAEALGAAARLYREWERPEAAQALGELSETYLQQWRRRQRALREGGQRERERPAADALDSLERRVDILRFARAAFAEAGDERNAEVLAGVIEYGELVLEGVDEERLERAAEAVPGKENLVEYLSWAAGKYASWGNEQRAAACRSLADRYRRELREEPREWGEERREPEAHGFEDRGRRIAVLRLARAAHAEAGHRDRQRYLERTIHLAQLQQAGADPEREAEAAEALSMEAIVEHVRSAAGLYREWGDLERAAECAGLVEFYVHGEGGGGEGLEHGAEHEGREAGRARAAEARAELQRVLQRLEELQRELQELRDAVDRALDH